jgi:hypothetical protein
MRRKAVDPLASVREADVLKSALRTFRTLGFPAFRMNTGALKIDDRFFRAGFKGASDIFAIVPRSGRWCVAEVKRPKGGRLTDDQRAFLATVRDAGGVALVVSDVAVLANVLTALREDPWAKFELDGRAA